MTFCTITLEQLANYRENRLSEAESAALSGHVDTHCPICAERLDWLREAAGAVRTDAFPEPPTAALKKARQLFRDRQDRVPVAETIARLLFNGFAVQPAFAGVRDGGADGVQLLFATDDHEIDLWGEAETPGVFYLIVSVRSKETGAVIVPRVASLAPTDGEGYASGGDTRLAVPETGGEFHFPAVSGGIYRLRLDLPETHITLPRVTVGDDAAYAARQNDR